MSLKDNNAAEIAKPNPNPNLKRKKTGPVAAFFKRNAGTLIGLVLLFAFFSVSTNNFFTVSNILTMLQNNVVNAIICCGMLMAIMMGQIDISVGSIVGLTAMVAAYLITNLGCNFWLALVVSFSVGIVIGTLNGFLIAYLKIPAFVATLATQSIARGFCKILSNGISIRIRNAAYNAIAGTKLTIAGTESLSANGRVPISLSITLLYAAIILLVTWILMNRTKFGYYIYAIGGNETAAKYSGIDTRLYNLLPYVYIGFLCAIGGTIWASRLQGVQSTLGSAYEMDAISAVVIGGASMSGGSGTIGGTIIGVLIVAVLSNGLNVMGVDSFWQDVFKGLIIIAAVVIDVLRKSRKK